MPFIIRRFSMKTTKYTISNDTIVIDSINVIRPSHVNMVSKNTADPYNIESLVIGHQSSWMKFCVANEAAAATPSTSNNNAPRIPAMPTSESVTNVPNKLAKNSGAIVAEAINVAAATSYKQTYFCEICSYSTVCGWRTNPPNVSNELYLGQTEVLTHTLNRW